MIYHINFGIGWASSGVEYAQKYRAKMLRDIQVQSKFVFLDFMSSENIQTLTSNLGFKDDEVIWLYQYFTDVKVFPTTFTVEDIINTINEEIIAVEQVGKIRKLILPGENNFITCYLKEPKEEYVDHAEFVSRGALIRKDYYTYTKLFSEYYAPKEKVAKVYMRHFYNEDGSIAYKEYIDNNNSIYDFKDAKLYSKAQFVAYFMQQLSLSSKDIVLIDRSTNIGQAILRYKGEAKVGVIVHAEHFSDNFTSQDTVLWNNFYDYVFTQEKHIDFYVTATETQRQSLIKQFNQYKNVNPKVFTIPVGSLDEIKTSSNRKSKSVITASRLAGEKHIDWITKAVIKAHKTLPDITLDIYGEGPEREKVSKIINASGANEYIQLKGHVNLKEVYAQYELFLSASQSEGFGLTLMEAVGSGLGMIGFNVNYGNPTFIRHGKNGYLMTLEMDKMTNEEMIEIYAQKIIDFFEQLEIEKVQRTSYKIAEPFLTTSIVKRWQKLIDEVLHD